MEEVIEVTEVEAVEEVIEVTEVEAGEDMMFDMFRTTREAGDVEDEADNYDLH